MNDHDLINAVGLMFMDAMSVKCEPSSYAESAIRLVRENDKMNLPKDLSDDRNDVELADDTNWKALPKDARDAILSAYLGIAVLETMCRVSKLESGRIRSRDLLTEMAKAFPVLPGLSALRKSPA